MTWVQADMREFAIGDRIRFTEEDEGDEHEGVVQHVGPRELDVLRDDGQDGGGALGGWSVNEEYNGPLYKWVPVQEPTWQPADITDFQAGDRIKFTDNYHHHNIEGTVVRVITTLGTNKLDVDRDDRQEGSGHATLDGMRNCWRVTSGNSRDLHKMTGTIDRADIPMRAVFCVVCGNATGEITNAPPTSRFCRQCEKLPELYDYNGEHGRGGFVNVEGGRTLNDTHRVAQRMRATGAGQYGAVTPLPIANPTVPIFGAVPTVAVDYWRDEEDEEDEEDTPTHARCMNCGEDHLRLVGAVYEGDAEATVYGGDYDEDDTLYFSPWDNDGAEVNRDNARVECTNCGHQYHGPWDLG